MSSTSANAAQPPIRLVVVGAGAIGAGVGGLLAHAGLEVVLVARGDHGRAIRDQGLHLRTPSLDVHLELPCVERLDQVDWQEQDVALVAVKLNHAEQVYADLCTAAGPDRTVVMGQNGMLGSTWAHRAGLKRVVDSMVWVPAQRLTPGLVDLHGTPIPGAIDLSTDAGLAAWLRRAGFRCTVRDDLLAWRRAKWLTNLCGAAFVFDLQAWVAELISEGAEVLRAAGLAFVSQQELQDYVGDISLDTIAGEERLPGGSTRQSAWRGAPLETRWLNGPLVALADQVGVDVPRNRALLAMARAYDAEHR